MKGLSLGRGPTAGYGLAFLALVFGGAGCHEPGQPPDIGVRKGAYEYDIRRFGSVGDGKSVNTAAIQSAIDAAHEAGGGIIQVPPGEWVTGTLRLRSNVTLDLAVGARLIGSTDLDDYPVIFPAFRSFTDNYVCQALVYAEDAENIGLTGAGTIDGRGGHEVFQQEGEQKRGRDYGYRPYLIRFVECRIVRVEGITLVDSPMWVQHYLACEDVVLKDVRVSSFVNHNNDMLDIDGCSNVRVSGCTGDSGDDAITLKSTSARICENITITNCVVSSHCNAIKCGTESNGGFRNITISNIAIRPSRLSAARGYQHKGLAGIALEVVDGGVMDRVTISNITMEGTTSPIFMRLGNRARPFEKDGPKPGVGVMRNIVISDVVCTGASGVGCPISGVPGHRIENVSISNVKLTFAGGGTIDQVEREVPEKESNYPESTMFGRHLPAYGFYIRHADGITLDNIDVRLEEPDRRAALYCDDVIDLHVDRFSAEATSDGAPSMILHDVDRAMITGCTASLEARSFLRLSGSTRGVSVIGNALPAAADPFELIAPVDSTVLFQSSNRTASPSQ